MAREFIMPGEMIIGQDALAQAGAKIAAMGKKGLIVTDQTMVDLGNVNVVKKVLEEQGVPHAVYPGINGEPTDIMIENGLAIYQEEGCDFLIGLGGGSPIDSMKAIAAMAVSKGEIADYMGKVMDGKLPPMVAIPTTAGTGSEATQFTIITDTKKDIKMLLKGPALMPDMALVDPRFTVTAPPKITAATGLDALTHAVEAYTSRKAQPLSDTFALSAVRRIFQYLPEAFRDGKSMEAREQMAIASLEAGIAFNNASVTLVHGMSRPVGALFHVPHGISNAMLLEKCLSFALEGAYERFARLGQEIHAAESVDPPKAAGGSFLKALIRLCNELQIPTLREYGIDEKEYRDAIDKMAHDAMASGSPQNTRKSVSETDLKEIYRSLF